MPNSKKHGTGYFMLIGLLLFLFFISCKKSEVRNDNFVKPIVEENALLTSAESFFNNNVLGVSLSSVGGSWEKRQKTALWGNAYIAKYPQRDIVVVPLEFEKGASIGSGILGTKKLSLTEQSKLILYKDGKGNFQAEVYTFIPEKEYEANPKGKFDGLVIIDDWAGNNKGNYIFTEGKYKKLMPRKRIYPGMQTDVNGGGGGDGLSCYFLNFYLCDVDASGAYSNCEYTGSVPLGCFDENGVETDWVDPGSNGGNGGGGVTYYPSDEIEAYRLLNWDVYKFPPNNVTAVISYENVRGKRSNTNPQNRYFISSSHHSDMCNDNNGVWGATNWNVAHTAQQLSSNISGIFSYHVGGGFSITSSKVWAYQEVFP